MALILDTGVVYAWMDRGDRAHPSSRELVESCTEMLVIPAVVLPEVDYLLSSRGGAGPMVALLRDVDSGALVLEDLEHEDYQRVADIVDRYDDVGFVDAAVLAIVERLGEPKLATLDRRHFAQLRPRHVESLELLPG